MFKHFGSKEGLFEAAITEPLESVLTEMADYAGRLATMSGTARARDSEQFYADILSTMLDVAPLIGVALSSDQNRGQAFYRQRLFPSSLAAPPR